MTSISFLSSQEEKIYKSALELGADTIAHIAKKAKLPRSSSYLIIEELKEKGLVSEIKKDSKTLITAQPPERLIDIIKDRKKEVELSYNHLISLLPQLKAIQNTKKDKPQISFYEGLEGLKAINNDTLTSQEILVLCSGYDKLDEAKLSKYLEEYFNEVDEKGIKTLEILGSAPDLDPYVKKFKSQLHQIKIAPWGKGLRHTDKLIFKNKVAIIDNENLNGVVIENKEIAAFERELFYQLWSSLN